MDNEEASISFSVEPDFCTLRLAGACGVANAEELRQTALELRAYHKDVRVDWRGARQIDASIAQVLLSLRSELREHGQSLAGCAGVPPSIQDWLRAAGLTEILGEASVVL
jgi:anti-anti-sigma regulatory factor